MADETEVSVYSSRVDSLQEKCFLHYNSVVDLRGGLGALAPRPKSQVHMLTYVFQDYLTSRYGF
jgi:hypothetical protein